MKGGKCEHFVGNTVYRMIYVAVHTQLGVFIMGDLREFFTIDKIITTNLSFYRLEQWDVVLAGYSA